MPSKKYTRHCSVHGNGNHRRVRSGAFKCLRCETDKITEFRRRRKEALVAYAGGACVECGYDRCLDALTFHHRDPAAKDFSISSDGTPRSWEKQLEEIAKCDLLCANCHAEEHARIHLEERGMRLLTSKLTAAYEASQATVVNAPD